MQRDPLVLWLRELPADPGVLVRAVVVQHDMQVHEREGSGEPSQVVTGWTIPKYTACPVVISYRLRSRLYDPGPRSRHLAVRRDLDSQGKYRKHLLKSDS